jgi:O-antigen ligase
MRQSRPAAHCLPRSATDPGGKLEKGGLAASLFFLALAFAAAGSAQAVVGLWAAAALALAALAALGRPGPAPTWLTVAAAGFAVLIVFNGLVLSPAYTPAALFHPLLFLLAFAAARRCPQRRQGQLFGGALAAALVLGVWGLAQVRLLGEARALAFLETPSTYAALLDLVLLPAAVWLLWGRGGRVFAVLVALLVAASLAALSRGAWVGALAGAGAALLLGARLPRPGARAWARLGAAMILGVLLSLLVRAPLPGAGPAHGEQPRDATARLESSLSRLELYAVSWQAYRARPVAGTGYLTFPYALERHRAEVPSYGADHVTYFAHNDYLQLLQETGPLGLLALAAFALLPYGFARRALARLGPEQKVRAVAAVAGLASMSVHALVDYPFYVPACLVLFGALLGGLDRLLAAAGVGRVPMPALPALPRAARIALVLLALFGLAQPVAAEGAAYWGRRQLGAGRSLAAAYWLQVASRLQPRDWRYHWYLGQFWQGQAFAGGGAEAVRLALREFDAGLRANPLEVRDLLGRIATYRLLGQRLSRPASAAELDAWSRQALAMAPLMPQARRERARVLEHIGKAGAAGARG